LALESTIRQLAKEHGTPVMLIEKDLLMRQFNIFTRKLPNITPYYAIKSNPHPDIIKTFLETGAGMDVASGKEIEWVLDAGATPDKIIFANPIKSEKDLKFAYENNITLMTFDSESELYKIAKHAPKSKVILRIRVANIGSVVELSRKFGADIEQACLLLKKAKKLGLIPEGISFHVGSQCANTSNYSNALKVAYNIFEDMEDKGIQLKILDIGGGFPIKHFEDDYIPPFDDITTCIKHEISKLFRKMEHVEFIAEPGRFFCGPAGTLITSVVGRTFRDNKNYYFLDDGIYQDFSGIIFDHCQYEFKTLKRGQKFLSTVAGPTCDSLDVLSLNEELPELNIGDVVYIKNIGAYSCASATPAFNGFSPAKIIVI